MLERFQVQLQENIRVENAVWHAFQEHDRVLLKIIFLQPEKKIFFVDRHRCLLVWVWVWVCIVRVADFTL